MGSEVASTEQTSGMSTRVSEWRYFRRTFFSRGLVVFGIVVILLFIVVAIFAPLLAPFPPDSPDLSVFLQQPSITHPLGTDQLGRDLLSRVIFGTRTSLLVAVSVVSISCISGIFLGLLAGYFGGWINLILMRLIDALMSFPMILLAMVIAALLGNGMRNVIIALSIALMPGFARMMCAQVLWVKENDYVLAGRSVGATNWRIMLQHVVPNCVSPLIVMITMLLGSVILAEAGLSFLLIGIQPPTATWGGLINDGRSYLTMLPMLSFAPGIVLVLVVFAFNMVGDGLRDALDPRLRGLL